MKKIITIIFIVISLTVIFKSHSRADLLDRGSGLIYDDILDITWMQNANYAEGTLSWNNAMNWVDSLTFQGYNDWRLPASDTSCTGKNCTDSEMGFLYYNYNITSDTPGIFTGLKSYMYWSETNYGPDSSLAWRFNFNTGYQGSSSKTFTRYAWAVRDGDSLPPVVPEPSGLALIITGGLSLGVRRLWGKRLFAQQ